MTNAVAKPLFHVSLGDRDEWVIEAEWPDGTLERVTTFKIHSAAAHWIATASEAWSHQKVCTDSPDGPADNRRRISPAVIPGSLHSV
jgi:hypothetical protein